MSNRLSLSHLNSAYQTAEAAATFATIPDGIYKGKITEAIVDRVQSTGNMVVKWRLLVAINKEKTTSITKINFLSEKGMPILKRDLAAIEIDPSILDPFDRLHDVLEYATGAAVEFKQTTKPNQNNPDNPYVNQDFMRLIKASGKPFPSFEPKTNEDGFEEVDDDMAWLKG